MGSEAPAAGAVAAPEQPPQRGRECARLSALELDRARHLALHRGGAHPRGAALLRARARRDRPRREPDRAGTVVRAAAAGRARRARDVPHALARLLTVHRGGPLERHDRRRHHRRARRRQAIGTPAPHHRPRPGRVDGDEEARGLLLMPAFAEATARKPGLLRICTAGSVDDGKSTLIGRLLYDSRGVYEDQVKSVRASSRNRTAGPIDFSLFTDGLRAERERGTPIGVPPRSFATARRKFILADTPGHEQYTRNMATGASTADLAVLLVDAKNGVRDQTRRHARIARLLGISNFVLAVNKIDLVGFDEGVFRSEEHTSELQSPDHLVC